VIARIAICGGMTPPFDYWIPAGLDVARGSVVRVTLNRRAAVGVVVALDDAAGVAPDKLHALDEVVALPPLPAEVMDVAQFVAGYYHEPIGAVLGNVVPPLRTLRGGRRAAAPAPVEPAFTRNAAQAAAVASIVDAAVGFGVLVLSGVTGSGKTAVYLGAAEAAIARGGQALILVPEINLTPQFERQVASGLPSARIVTLHSGLAAGTRNAHWRAAAAGEADVILGTRLAVFAPVPKLALVVVDEEHDPSYKQQDGVRYHARDVAIWRAHARDVPIVLGSATPSLETLHNVEAGRYRLLALPARARAAARAATVRLVPVRDAGAHDGIAGPIWDALAARLAAREQSLVFVNRRGFAPALKCASCAWQATCPHCSARLVLHRSPALMRCHHCGHAERPPRACPQCGNVDLLPQGHGTQRLEQALAQAFPVARVVRVDRDSTRARGAFATIRERVHDDDVDILVGTQMLAKGHDFPRLTLVGVLGADNALYSGDFRATERLGALLAQVAGRAGRGNLAGEVLVATDFPGHPVFAALGDDGYAAFAQGLFAERRAAGLPPYAHLALLSAEAAQRDDVDAFLAAAHAAGVSLAREFDGVEVNPPVTATLSRRADRERAQLLVQSRDRRALQAFLVRFRASIEALPARRVRVALDVDPATF
jgi:primosomal protein N' (replication factor Y) (superfamily II helicase)